MKTRPILTLALLFAVAAHAQRAVVVDGGTVATIMVPSAPPVRGAAGRAGVLATTVAKMTGVACPS